MKHFNRKKRKNIENGNKAAQKERTTIESRGMNSNYEMANDTKASLQYKLQEIIKYKKRKYEISIRCWQRVRNDRKVSEILKDDPEKVKKI